MARRLTDRERQLRSIVEDQLSETIVDRPDLNRHNGLAQRLGWRVRVQRKSTLRPSSSQHQRWAGDVGTRGFPDLTLVHPRMGRLIFAELKRETTQPNEQQIAWLDDLALLRDRHARDGEGDFDVSSGPGPIEVYLWRPRHLAVLPQLLGREWWRIDHRVDLGSWPGADQATAGSGH